MTNPAEAQVWTEPRHGVDLDLTLQTRGPVGGVTKRVIDIAISLLLLVMFGPLMVVIASLIWAQRDGPILYRQTRVGFGGGSFPCLKFRSMIPNANQRLEHYLAEDSAAQAEWALTRKLSKDPRITPLGVFLRKSSVDELPQLANVLMGHMSMVGPRPIVEAEIAEYAEHFVDYTRSRPGLSGRWQISGRSDITYRERVQLDVHYVRNWSVPSDLGILAKTVPAVLTG
jgi:exopolysaccharide production protein ExoY